MTFVTAGLAIAGLAAVVIPIIIHLLARQRRKPIEWAAMRFLLEAFRRHKRRLRIEQLLLLAVRCLIVGLLGFALARPLLQAAGLIASGGSRHVYLVIDDGMASGVVREDGRTALQHHLRQAVDLVNTLGPGDAVGVITAARPARAVLWPPSTDRAAVVHLLQSFTSQESPTDLPAAFGHLRAAVDESKSNQQQTLVYLFSEFRSGSASLDSPLPSTHVDQEGEIRLLASSPSTTVVSNVQITSIEPVRHLVLPGSSDGSEQITVRLSRTGGQLGGDVSTVRLVGESLPAVEAKVVQWQPGQEHADVKFMVNFAAAAADRSLGLSAVIDDDALRADNQRHIVLDVRPQIRVLLVDRRSFGFERSLDQLSAGQWIRRALEPRGSTVGAAAGAKSPIQIVEVEPSALDVADIRTADVAILPRPDLLSAAGWSVLRQFVQNDGLLILMPPGEVNVHQWTEHLGKDLQLPWRVALETAHYPEGLPLAEEQPSTELLRLISNDLTELARPVLTHRSLPVDRAHLTTSPADAGEVLLAFADGSAMVVAGSPAAPETSEGNSRGLIVYLASAPELSWTNLPSKPLMVPLFQEIVRQGLSAIRAIQRLQVGEQPTLAVGPAARQLAGPNGQAIALEPSGRPQQVLPRAGVYSVRDQADHPIGKIAVNIDARAGLTSVQSAAAVTSWLNASGTWSTFDAANIADSLVVDRPTSPIAGMLLLIVLGLLVIETVLARWFSHAYQNTAVGSRLTAVGVFAEGRKPMAEGQA